MKVLIIGGGGREHCLAWKISSGGSGHEVYAAPGNAGMKDAARCVDIEADDFHKLADFAQSEGVDLTVVGPEAPLVKGIADYFKTRGLRIFGPGSEGAQLEGSKVFTKRLACKYSIPSAEGVEFCENDYEAARKYLKDKGRTYPLVLKADGLAAGKGVIIAQEKDEAIKCLDDFFLDRKFGDSGSRIIIEDFLNGFEVSMLCLYDGKSVLPMDLAQDYKKIYDEDKGPNTGGMGSYSPVPVISEKLKNKVLNKIIYPTCEGLRAEGIDYRGVLYAGLMIIGQDDPYLLEYNCRFGDPETQAILPRLKGDLTSYLFSCTEQNLGSDKMIWDDQKCVCVIAASRGYPQSSSKGDVIGGLDEIGFDGNLMVFHAGVKSAKGNLATNGGRVLGISAKAGTFKQARSKAYRAIGNISFSGMQYRKDIALRVEEN